MVDYSKWDNLEISDDSDIEVHPNVDKRSMIKWKQEAIHRERAERKAKMDYIETFIPQQQKTLKSLQEFTRLLNDGPNDEAGIKRVVAALDEQQKKADPTMTIPSKDNKEGINLAQVFATMKSQIATGLAQTTPSEVKKTLLDRFAQTENMIQKTVNEASAELEKLQKEAGRKLTSENMFTVEKSSKTIINKPKPLPKKSTTEKTKVVETLNPGVSMKDLSLQDTNNDADDEDDEAIDMSPKAARFSKIRGFEDSFKFLNSNPDIINEKTSDSILGEAFTAQLKGEETYAKNCVIQSLMVQYCGQLGKGGVQLFFTRMQAPNSPARKMFFDDVEKTYNRIHTRCAEIAAEEVTPENGVETIQLQPMGDGTQLTIRVPQPEDTEAYDVFTKMPAEFQESLKTGKLDEINKVLEKIPVPQAEELVRICSDYGFLDVEGEVIDETQQATQ